MYNLELAMCILPELDEETGITEIERVKVYLCIAEALDLTIESGANSIVFTPWPIASTYSAAEIMQLCISYWLRTSSYAQKVLRTAIATFQCKIYV